MPSNTGVTLLPDTYNTALLSYLTTTPTAILREAEHWVISAGDGRDEPRPNLSYRPTLLLLLCQVRLCYGMLNVVLCVLRLCVRLV